MPNQHHLRTRWSAVGAAVAVTLGAGGLTMAQASVTSGEKPITVTVPAERILDTRTNLGLTGRFQSGTPRDLQVTGAVDVAPSGTKTVVPAGAVGVLVNVTVVSPSNAGFVSLRRPGTTGKPATSTVNFLPGSVEPNAATADLSADGKVQIWLQTGDVATGNADVLVDVVGYTIDHNHDDRYYTQSEVDAEVAAAVAAAVAPKADLLDVYAGQLTVRFPSDVSFVTVGDTFPRPLPAKAATPTLEYIPSGSSTNCPGIGQAATVGILCVYGYNSTANLGTLELSGGSIGENKRYGFSITIIPSNQSAGFFIASWAYRAP